MLPDDFDALRRAPLPDSFGRTAAWLCAPRRRTPAGPLVAVLAAVVLVSACAFSVSAPLRLGSVVEVKVADPYAFVRALDTAVPPDARFGTEVEPLPGGRFVVRYSLLADATDAARGAARALADSVRVAPLSADVRTPLGIVAARQIGVSITPRLSDAETQAALDRAFAGSRLAPRVGLDPAGRRIVTLAPGVRLVLRPGMRVVNLDRAGAAVGVLLGWPTPEATPDAILDSLLGPDARRGARPAARSLSTDDAARLLDSLGVDLDALRSRPGDSVRTTITRIPR